VKKKKKRSTRMNRAVLNTQSRAREQEGPLVQKKKKKKTTTTTSYERRDSNPIHPRAREQDQKKIERIHNLLVGTAQGKKGDPNLIHSHSVTCAREQSPDEDRRRRREEEIKRWHHTSSYEHTREVQKKKRSLTHKSTRVHSNLVGMYRRKRETQSHLTRPRTTNPEEQRLQVHSLTCKRIRE
jgi:hypothetical protein